MWIRQENSVFQEVNEGQGCWGRKREQDRGVKQMSEANKDQILHGSRTGLKGYDHFPQKNGKSVS